MTIFLHIGTEKTGTTYIQNFLRDNQSELLKQGFLYPRTPGEINHTKLTAYAQDDNTFDDLRSFLKTKQPQEVIHFRKAFEKEFFKELKRCPVGNIIFSGEHCSSRLLTHREISRLKDLLDQAGHDIKVIIYLRRQDQYLLSTYSTWVKSGATGKLELPSARRANARYDFAVLLDRWAEVFGTSNLLVRPYNKDCLVSGELLQDFAHCVGLKIGRQFVMPSEKNESLDAEVLEYLRNLNSYLPGILDEGGPGMRAILLKFLTKISSKNGLTMDQKTLKDFLQQFEESNQYVQEKYFDKENPAFFPMYKEDTSKVQQTHLGQDMISKISAELWLLAYQEIVSLRQQIQKLSK